MLSLIEQIKSGKLWDFPGGIHPPENKTQSTRDNLVQAKIPSELILPIKQHIGKAGDLIVEPGSYVLKGQPLTKCNTAFTVPVHAPTSGTVVAIEQRTVAHPSGLTEPCIIIAPDFKDTWCERNPMPDYPQTSPEDLIEKVRQAGISGMGGAGFPTARKIESGQSKIEMLVVNAAECEPYITADDMLMREHAEEIIAGIKVVEHILAPKMSIIGIEDNKPQAIAALQKAAEHEENIVIRVVPTKYPSGGAKQLIKILTNLEVPSGGRSTDIGQMVLNVGTIQAIKRAVIDDEPLIRRVVTLTGKAFKRQRNVWALLGTPIQSLLDEFGHKADRKMPRLIMGGPLMGFTLPHAQVPITKIANCILAPTRREIAPARPELSCIRCSACADACPVSLLPQQLYWHAKAEEYDKCEELNLKECIECGACAYVCPSDIPLVQYYRQAKAEIRSRRIEAEAAERAKQRFEEKKARLEREKEERENRFKKAAENRRSEMKKSSGGDDAIAAAIARVQAQKAQPAAEKTVKPAVAAAIAKAKAKQAQAMQSGAQEPDNSEMAKLREERKRQARERKAQKATEETTNADVSNPDEDKKASVAAAIARAKARKAAQQTEPSDDSAVTQTPTQPEAEDPKKAAVAAAIARAKARKAAQQTEPSDDSAVTQTPTQPEAEDPKKAAVAAAIARAKARKAAQQTEPSDDSAVTQTPTQPEAEDPKKAAVAAAIARAKARKAAQQTEPSDDSAVTQTPTQPEAEDPKKAAVAAAIARAKARKAAQQTEPSDDSAVTQTPTQPEAEAEDPKKAAVAAAIARAKARKAAQKQQDNQSEEND
ncbi:electron transport complex subunit RsxC [Vibrio tritonius]|uniref:electron transport complex subunit RsxC n=1 Tax=Vibrio tritonius TaxID=1435069 RepID=UPI00315CB2EC